MPKKRTSIRTLLLVLTAAVAVPLLGLFGYYRYKDIRSDIHTVEERLLSQARATALSLRQFVFDSENLLAGFAMDPGIRSLNPDSCSTRFPQLLGLAQPTYTNIFTNDASGQLICSALDASGQSRPTNGPGPWYSVAREAEGFTVGPVQRGAQSQRWVTVFSYPLTSQGGERVGWVSLAVDLVRFQRMLANFDFEEGRIISVIERDGRIVARSRDSDRYVGTQPQTPSAGTQGGPPQRASVGFSRSPTLEGVDYLWAYALVPSTDWIVYSGLPRVAVYGPVWSQWFWSSVLALSVLAFVFLLGRNILQRITDPLAALVRETGAAHPGEPSNLSEEGPTEIALVAERFNEAWEAWMEAEEERRHSVERIRSLVENAVTGIYVSTEEGTFLEVNQAMVDLLGYNSREELLATPVSALYTSVEDRLETLAAHGRKEFFRGVQVLWKTKDGSPITVRLFGRRFKNAQGEVSWEVIVEDVTKLRTLQEQYLQSQKMEALGRLAGGVAHDFNNLLTVIQGQAEFILDDPAVGEDLKGQIQEIADAASRGADLNHQLLSFGRRSGERREALDLNRVLRGFEIMIRRAAGEEISVEIVTEPELGWVLGDRGQIEQVLMNLVVNARDAMPRGGTLHLETSNVEVPMEEAAAYPPATPGPHVVLTVRDSGTGIHPEVLPNIFEPFFSTKPESKGTGLGLATVYGIVTDSGGHIRLESRQGVGTSFRLFFPIQKIRPLKEMATAGVKVTRTGSGRILLAEDEDAVRRLTSRILERAGYQVLQAADGKEALDLARELSEPVDLLLSDVVMPEIRGPELAEILGREGRVQRVVLFSGYPEGLREAGLKGVGRWELISKPFSSAELLAAVERAMERDDTA